MGDQDQLMNKNWERLYPVVEPESGDSIFDGINGGPGGETAKQGV